MLIENQKESEIAKSDAEKTSEASLTETLGISIMTDPDLHPLPITPNDPLPIVSIILFIFNIFYSSKLNKFSLEKFFLLVLHQAKINLLFKIFQAKRFSIKFLKTFSSLILKFKIQNKI